MGRALGVADASPTLDALIVSGNTQLGDGATRTLSFFGVTAIAQRAGATQATLSVTITATVSCVGFTTTAQMQTLLDQLAEVRNSLVAYGLWKGAA